MPLCWWLVVAPLYSGGWYFQIFTSLASFNMLPQSGCGPAWPGHWWCNTGRDRGWSEPGSRGGGGQGTTDIYVTPNCRAVILFNALSRRLMRFVFLFALQWIAYNPVLFSCLVTSMKKIKTMSFNENVRISGAILSVNVSPLTSG